MRHLFEARACRRVGGRFETLKTGGCQGEVVSGLGLCPVGKEALRVKTSIPQFHMCPHQ
jgi:hypothetical protein